MPKLQINSSKRNKWEINSNLKKTKPTRKSRQEKEKHIMKDQNQIPNEPQYQRIRAALAARLA
jgi:hypothetical protein